jgi:DNA polymerase-3 subunit delta'
LEYFSSTKIQPQVLERLRQSIINNRLAHAFLFYGPEGCGKEAIAIELAKALNCQDDKSRPCNQCTSCHKINHLNHPDIKFVFPISNSWSMEEMKERQRKKAENLYSKIDLSGHTLISIEKVRDLKNESKYAPYEAIKKVFILSDADKMTRESANSFLKLLEEPPDNLLLILITSSLKGILDTIRSRCQRIYFPQLSFEEALYVVEKYRQSNN